MKDPTRTILALCEAMAPAAVVLSSALLDGSDAGSVVSRSEIITAILASIVTGAAYNRALRRIGAHPDVLSPVRPRRAAQAP